MKPDIEGKYTLEDFAALLGIKKTSALNLLSKLKKQNRVTVSGGGRQKRIYTISRLPVKKTRGFYDIVNKYSKIKLVPKFRHYAHGRYTVENAIIDGILIGDSRTLEASSYLFKRVNDWKRLFELAKEKKVVKSVYKLYYKAKKSFKCRTMPKRYINSNKNPYKNDKHKRSGRII